MKLKLFMCFFCVGLTSGGGLFAAVIHDAARSGDLEAIRKIIEKAPSAVNALDDNRMTPLHHAVETGKMEAASLLISKGAHVDAINTNKETPLHIASMKGNAQAVRFLLRSGADPQLREHRSRTPLFLAVNWGGNREAVRILLDAGAHVNDTNSNGENLFVHALFTGRKDIIDLLIDSGAVLPEDEATVRRVLWVSASFGLERAFNMAVEISSKKGMEWGNAVNLHACARGGSLAITQALLQKGHQVNSRNLYGIEPLHIAAENGHIDLVNFFIDNGADINSKSRAGKTAYHFALENGYKELAEALAAKGAVTTPPEFPLLRGDYLGQVSPGEKPERFLPGIVSGHQMGSEHSPAVFSPDLKEMYWTQQFRGPILYMKQEDGIWSSPEKASFCSEYGDGEPIFSPDGSRIYFLSFRPIDPGGPSDKENMWVVERREEGWSEPRPVSPLINAFKLHWLFSVSRNGTIYFASIKEGGFGLNDIYCSRYVEGEYQKPENLGTVINHAGVDHTPFIAPDESYLIYATSGESTSPGDLKFHISFRAKDGSWMKPVQLSPEINSVALALCPSITPDGRYMFFIGDGDIFWVDAGFVEKLRPAK